MTIRYTLYVSYPGLISRATDRVFEAILGYADGSGMGFGRRDLEWIFDSRPDAEAAQAKALALGVEGTMTTIGDYDDEDEAP